MDPDVVHVILVCLAALALYVLVFLYFVFVRVFFVKAAMSPMPNDVGVYERLPEAGVFTAATLPPRFRRLHRSEADTWINYRVRQGTAIVQLPPKPGSEDPVNHFVDEASYALVLPRQQHCIAWMSEEPPCHIVRSCARNWQARLTRVLDAPWTQYAELITKRDKTNSGWQ